MYIDYYPSELPVISDELYNVATKTMVIAKWKKGANVKKSMKVLDILIGNNEKPNLYAMRSTYHFGLNDFRSAISDIESAQKLDQSNLDYALASLAYKTKYTDSYSLEERMNMLDMYNDYIVKYPDNKALFFNRAVLMDKIGYLTGAMTEYDELLEGATPTGANYNNRGVVSLKAYRFSEAEADFKKAIEADPDMAEPYFNLAVIYAVHGLTEKCTTNLDMAIERDKAIKDLIMTNNAFTIMKDTPKFDKYR